MYNSNNHLFRRTSVRTNFGMNPPPRQTSNIRRPQFETPGAMPTGDGSQLNQPVGGSRTGPQSFQQPNPASQTNAKPQTAPKLETQVKGQGRGTKMSSKTKKGRKQKQKEDTPFMYVPRGGRPKPPEGPEFTGRDNVPQGQEFYDGGPRVTTSSPHQPKLDPIRTLKQVPDLSAFGANSLGQIRTLFQVIKPQFFGQLNVLDPPLTGASDAGLDDTHTQIYRDHYQIMRTTYQTFKSINSAFEAVFTYENTYTYFYDTFALYAELVCLIQGAAYHLNDSTGCDNVLLSAIANTLNKTDFHTARNDMARVLRFSYLPDFCIDEAYEMFQTYRVGSGTTSGSMRFVTINMMRLLIGLGAATSTADIHSAIDTYFLHISHLMSNVKNGRPNSDSERDNNNVPNREWFNVSGDSTATNNNKYNVNIFPAGSGALTADQRQSIESFLFEISKNCKISMLNNIRRGNSESYQSLEWSDMWNNTPFLDNASNTSFPARITGGGTENNQLSPAHTTNTIYCSETRPENISFKQVQFMLQRFSGYSPILWKLDTTGNVPYSRWFALQTSAKSDLSPEDDILCMMAPDFTDFTLLAPTLIQNNYVTKVFNYTDVDGNTATQGFNNPDGMSEGQWYLTLGDLRNSLYNHGISLL